MQYRNFHYVRFATSNPEVGGVGVGNLATSPTTETGEYTNLITGLDPNQIYYVWANATHPLGTSYGNEISFATIPTLGEWGLKALGSLTAILGGWFVWRRFVV